MEINSGGLLELMKKYKFVLFFLGIFIIILIISILISEKVRVNICLDNLKVYPKYLQIDSILRNEDVASNKLSNFYVASSYKSCVGTRHKFDYVSTDILEHVLKAGARFVWLDIFNETMEKNTSPVVSSGSEEGEWQYTLNTILFEDCCKTIKDIAFVSGEVDNYNDPLFLALNLNVNRNINTLNKIKDIIFNTFENILLPYKYSYTQKNLGQIKISDLLGKIVILASTGFEDTELEELINYSWDKEYIRLINFKNIIDDQNPDVIKMDKEELQNYNNNNLSIVLPEDNSINSINYDPNLGWNSGCQFVCMNYQILDKKMDSYITKFKTSSFINKPIELTGKFSNDDVLSKNVPKEPSPSKSETHVNCPEKPSLVNKVNEDTLNPDMSVLYKDSNKKLGVCGFSTSCPIDYTEDGQKKWKEMKLGLSLVMSNEDKKNNDFDFGCINSNAGNTPEGYQFINWKPKICCSTLKKNTMTNMYTLSPQCHKPEDFNGTVGIKVKDKDVSRTPFTQGTRDGEYTWVYPKICKIENEDSIKKGKNCVLSSNPCPRGWKINGGDIDLENGWKLCCRNN